ncbi:MAG: hypothetical protein ACJAUA_001087 [Zhongshania aliphaticivorans]|jgi:hypothetical protein
MIFANRKLFPQQYLGIELIKNTSATKPQIELNYLVDCYIYYLCKRNQPICLKFILTVQYYTLSRQAPIDEIFRDFKIQRVDDTTV